jgi:hypothetical protein
MRRCEVRFCRYYVGIATAWHCVDARATSGTQWLQRVVAALTGLTNALAIASLALNCACVPQQMSLVERCQGGWENEMPLVERWLWLSVARAIVRTKCLWLSVARAIGRTAVACGWPGWRCVLHVASSLPMHCKGTSRFRVCFVESLAWMCGSAIAI